MIKHMKKELLECAENSQAYGWEPAFLFFKYVGVPFKGERNDRF